MSKEKAIFAVDIGNTVVHCGVFYGIRILKNFSFPSSNKTLSFYVRSLRNCIRKYRIVCSDVDRVVLCSVVPMLTPIVRDALKRFLKTNILIVGRDVDVPLKNNYKKPNQLGMDRLLAAFAACKLYGPGVIIVDFGTAVTFDVVNKKGEFAGGMIFPGLDLSLDALHHHTALLPAIDITNPQSLLGRDTVACINSGIVFGMAGVCDGIIVRLKKRFKNYNVVATGGNIPLIKRYSSEIKIVRPALVLEGLNFLINSK